MNTTLIIIILVLFFMLAEFLTIVTRKETTFIVGYVSLVRCLVFCLMLCTICILDRYQDNSEYCAQELEYYELLNKNQTQLIDELIEHDEEFHQCDCPILDGDLPDIIKQTKQQIDSLYYKK